MIELKRSWWELILILLLVHTYTYGIVEDILTLP